ncbi:hypothetical protein [Paraburkholderia xenovorans]
MNTAPNEPNEPTGRAGNVAGPVTGRRGGWRRSSLSLVAELAALLHATSAPARGSVSALDTTTGSTIDCSLASSLWSVLIDPCG